jgi:hypothetical protein
MRRPLRQFTNELPTVLRWFTANIGLHRIHHLCSRIPFYRLPLALARISGGVTFHSDENGANKRECAEGRVRPRSWLLIL